MSSWHDKRGSVAMETVVVLPVFVIIVFFILQVTLVWGAKQMVAYAAYCGARAALVYNPADYDSTLQKDGHWQTTPMEAGGSQHGVVHFAACTVLSWVSWTLSRDMDFRPKTFAIETPDLLSRDFQLGLRSSVPLSSRIRDQVRVEVKEFETIKDDNDKDNSSAEESDDPTPIERQFPAVTVRVRFEFPLFIPLGGSMMAYFFGAGKTHINTTGAIGSIGFTAPGGQIVHNYLELSGRYYDVHGLGVYTIPLEESCTLAKPYKTDTYPLMSSEEHEIIEKAFRGLF